MSALLEVEDLRVEGRRTRRGAFVPIVRGVSFALARGEVLALIGESGAGKSTIALAALGYAKPGCRFAGGTVRFEGASVLEMSLEEKRAIRGARISYVAQSAAAAFNDALRLDDQITEVSLAHGGTRAEAEARMHALARRMRLPEPERIVRKYPHQVSGGQLQRLMAVMAMNAGPDLLILDEPTTALDVTTQVEVLAAFKDTLAASGAAAVYVSHDLAVVAQVADRILVLKDGAAVEHGPTERILHDPREPYTREMMAAVRPPRQRNGATGAETARASDPVLSLRGVSAGFGGRPGRPAVTVLHDIDLDIPRGGTVGVIGESGCGKSTLARVIAGLLPAAAGEIRLDGEILPADAAARRRDALRRVQIVMQMPDVAFNPLRTVGEALARPLAYFHRLPTAARKRRVAELLEMVELPSNVADRRPQALSGGQKQRVNLARALAAEPEVILCDEVTSALDTVVGAQIIRLLKRLQTETGVTFVFISHDLSTVASFADRIAVLYAGRIAEEGPTARVLSPPHHPYAALLLQSVPELRRGWLEATRQSARAERAAGSAVEIGRTGCPFHPRCPAARPGVCDVDRAPVHRLADGHRIACHRELAALVT
ncbi:MAG: ABC transporter ATP-binding protein [Paracoccaceae bacterium]